MLFLILCSLFVFVVVLLFPWSLHCCCCCSPALVGCVPVPMLFVEFCCCRFVASILGLVVVFWLQGLVSLYVGGLFAVDSWFWFGFVSVLVWFLVGFIVIFWFGSGCLVVGGNFGGDLLLNF